MGSRSFGGSHPLRPHLVRKSGGLAAEIMDLRRDIDAAFTSLETYVDSKISESGQGFIYLTDAASPTGGMVSDQVYQNPPDNTVLQSFTCSTVDVRLTINASYPEVRVITLAGAVNETLTPSLDEGHYSGTVDVVVDPAGETIGIVVLTPEGLASARDDVAVAIELPPQLLDLYFTGGYPDVPWIPGTPQTELKAGDTFDLHFVSDLPCTGATVLNDGAGTLQTFAFASATSGTVSITIADRGTTLQNLAAKMKVHNAAGAFGNVRATNELGGSVDGHDLVALNNRYPSGSVASINYPAGQSALKDAESATFNLTASNYDTAAFTSPSAPAELSIANPSTFEAAKVVTRIAGNTRFSGVNFRMVLSREANGSQTTVDSYAAIAHVAISAATITLPAARLRSGGNNGTAAQSHTITIALDQPAYAAPSLAADVNGGTWLGSWTGGPSSWTRSLSVHDNDVHASHNWGAFSVTNRAGKVTTTIAPASAAYTIGGFVARTLTFAAFSQSTTMNVPVVTYTKLTFGVLSLNNHQGLRNATQGNHADIVDTLTVDSIGTNPTTVWLNDVTLAGQNTLGTLTIADVQETV